MTRRTGPLAPRWSHPDEVERLRVAWETKGAVRLAPAFPEATAVDYLRALRVADYRPVQYVHLGGKPDGGYQLWRYGWAPTTDYPLCNLGRWLWGDAVTWLSSWTGAALSAPENRMLLADRACKSAYFEAYDDAAEGRSLAFLVHLTPGPWPASFGGHLEIMDSAGGPVIDTWEPAWNALDVFDVRDGRWPTWRRMPMLTEHVEGYTIAGWL